MKRLSFERAGFLAVVAVFAAGCVYLRLRAPAVASVNGAYRNPCCSDIVLRDGVVMVDGERVPFRLEHMKFGLTAHTKKRLEVYRGHVVTEAVAGEGALLFDDTAQSVTICDAPQCRGTHVFKRKPE